MRTLYLAVTIALGFVGVSEAPLLYTSYRTAAVVSPLPPSSAGGTAPDLAARHLRFSPGAFSTTDSAAGEREGRGSPLAERLGGTFPDGGATPLVAARGIDEPPVSTPGAEGIALDLASLGGDPVLHFAAPGAGLEEFFNEPEQEQQQQQEPGPGQTVPEKEGIAYPPTLPGASPGGGTPPDPDSAPPKLGGEFPDEDSIIPGTDPHGGVVVPEPSSLLLAGAGVLAIALLKRKRALHR